MGEQIRLTVDAARGLALGALAGIGYGPEDAAILADHMLDAALCGYEYSGLPKILNLADYLAGERPTGSLPAPAADRRPSRERMRIVHETPMSVLFDGAGENGMLTLHHATDAVLARAQATGMAVAGVHHTWMSGRSACFVERIARAGCIGMLTISSRPQVAPPGGIRPGLGTNPVAFGFPADGDPLVVDLGTAALMFTDLALRARRGEPLPDGVAIDADGRPTTDPARAQAGAVLPFGGHKGFALGVAMQAFGVLAGAGLPGSGGVGYLVLAMRPDLMLPLADYRRQLSASLAALKATPRRPDVDEIRLPSERAHRERRRQGHDGITIDRAVHDALLAWAGRAGPPGDPAGP